MNMRARFAALTRNETGTAAVELGIVAPILIVAFVLMTDVGLAVGTRMEMDRNVRAGVQAAMSQINDVDRIKQMILSSAGESENMSITVNKTCACGGAATSCNDWCSADEAPSVFVNISASQPYSGLMLPAFSLDSETRVQLR